MEPTSITVQKTAHLGPVLASEGLGLGRSKPSDSAQDRAVTVRAVVQGHTRVTRGLLRVAHRWEPGLESSWCRRMVSRSMAGSAKLQAANKKGKNK